MRIGVALLLGIASWAAGADTPDSSRVVEFSGGTVVIETFGSAEHVTVKDSNGKLRSESECGGTTGTYDQLVAFAKALKKATSNANEMSTLILYPLNVNLGKGKHHSVIASDKTLHARFGAIFTPAVVAAIEASEPNDVFCRNGMAMVGHGVVSSTMDRDGSIKASVINQ